MNIEIRTDKNIQSSDRLIDYIRNELKSEFHRFSEKITHFEVHLSDEDAAKEKGDDDKQCMIEARPAGLKPVVVKHKANNIDAAISGAIDKLKRSIEQTFAKQDPTRVQKPDWTETE